jgi:pimeloyl-ACP methyl ester carboxylesterase
MQAKRTWILLRGLVREQRHWEGFPDVFQTYLPDDEIILYDFPGNGQRYKEKSAGSIIDMVDDVRSFALNRSANQPVYIVALSLGGMAAVEWMNRYPKDCAGAVLISTSLRGLNPFYQRLLPSNYPAIIKSLILPGNLHQKESRNMDLVSNIIANDPIKRDTTIKHWVSYAEQCPVSALNALRQLLAATRFQVPAHRPEVPILVLRSLGDQLVSPRCSLSLARHWGLALQTHETSGHDIPLDDGDWVCQKIRFWLTNNN